MKAVLCKELGLPEKLVVEDVPSPEAGKGQVVLSVKASGVNFPDTLIIQGKYQFKPELPFSPGGEVAGVVKTVGEGVTSLKLGDRVIASSGWGGFAEELVVDATRTIPMPDNMDFVPASGFVLTYGTSYHALKDRAQLKAGETMLVLGNDNIDRGLFDDTRDFGCSTLREYEDFAAQDRYDRFDREDYYRLYGFSDERDFNNRRRHSPYESTRFRPVYSDAYGRADGYGGYASWVR